MANRTREKDPGAQVIIQADPESVEWVRQVNLLVPIFPTNAWTAA